MQVITGGNTGVGNVFDIIVMNIDIFRKVNGNCSTTGKFICHTADNVICHFHILYSDLT